ncbi:MAG: M20/M25/M40 family metallo-hydrolase [Pseudomonadota bacterium]
MLAHIETIKTRRFGITLMAWMLGMAFANSVLAQKPADETRAVSSGDTAILATIEADGDAALSFLEDVVNVNSGTLNVIGVRAVGDMFAQELEAIGFATRWIDMPEEMARAGHMVATRTFGAGKGPHLLLIGHLDTVFEENSPFQTFERDNDIARGPGIADMKGGNVAVLYALKALVENDALRDGKITVFFTGDEETAGSPLALARKDLIAAGKAADVALNFEGMSPGYAVIGRRGSSNWSVEVTAKQAHSSGIFNDSVGAGAAFELARILNRFYGEVRGPFGLTFNAGVVAAGTIVEAGRTKSDQSAYGKGNVVPNKAVANGGLRFMNEAQKEAAREAMRKIVAASLPQTTATITFEDRYPAMEASPANEALLARLNSVHMRLGESPVESFPPERRGAADISFVAPYVTGMDGLGVDGQGAHSPRELMYVPSLAFATRRAALLIADLINNPDDGA